MGDRVRIQLRESFFVVVIAVIALALCSLVGVGQAQAEELAPGSGTLAKQSVAPAKSTQPMYRMYNRNTGEHLYTANIYERNHLNNIGWFYEGVAWVAPKSSKTPVYRLYNPNSSDHHYTTSKQECNSLTPLGWRYEGVAWYSDDQKRRPIYRVFNPNETVGTHHYSESKNEVNGLARIGWHDEGLGWYGAGPGWYDSLPLNYNHIQYLLSNAPTSGGVEVQNGSIDDALRGRINSYLRPGIPIGFIAVNLKTGKVVSHDADLELFSASSIKASYLAAVCKYNAPGVVGWRGTMANIIATSDNEDYAAISGHYGKGYLQQFANEAGVYLDLNQYQKCYVDYTPRKLCKLWTLIQDYMYSNQVNADMYRSFYTGEVYKMGWMTAGAWSGIIHNIAGRTGDVVYALLTREPSKVNLFNLRNEVVNAAS